MARSVSCPIGVAPFFFGRNWEKRLRWRYG
jgi:hypothetical protein